MKKLGRIGRFFSLSLMLGSTIMFAQAGGGGSAGGAAGGAKGTSKSTTSNSKQTSAPAASQTGPDAVPVIYNGKFVDLGGKANGSDDSCRSKLVQTLWGIRPASGASWQPFRLTDRGGPASSLDDYRQQDDLTATTKGLLPSMNPFLYFSCKDGKAPNKKFKPAPPPIIVHASTWRRGTSTGDWSEVTSQWQVYRSNSLTSQTGGTNYGLLADGYSEHAKGDPPDPRNAYLQPGGSIWPMKPALYNDPTARFIGVGCFYDWDGLPLADPSTIKGVTLNYKIGTVVVVPDNISNLTSVLTALFPGLGTGGGITPNLLTAEVALLLPDFVNPPAIVAPGKQARYVVTPGSPGDYNFQVNYKSGAGTPADVRIDAQGTLTVSASAKMGTQYTITATKKSDPTLAATADVTIAPSFIAPSANLVPGDQVRYRIDYGRPSDYSWDVNVTSTVGSASDFTIDNFGTLNVSLDALPGTAYTVTAISRADPNIKPSAQGTVSGVLPCLVASGGVNAASLPSDINITLSLKDANAKPTGQTLTAASATSQSAIKGKPFQTLKVVLRDASGKPVNGAPVTFTAPAAAPTATLPVTSATTDSSGMAQVDATAADDTLGKYVVTASSGNLSVRFLLENKPEPA
jgi:hypothetical protein